MGIETFDSITIREDLDFVKNGIPNLNVVDSKTQALNGTKTRGYAWRLNGNHTPGSAYSYTRYDLSTVDIPTLLVSGASWGNDWPLASFYNSDDTLIKAVAASSQTSYIDEHIAIPPNASYLVVNGMSGGSGGVGPEYVMTVISEFNAETQRAINEGFTESLNNIATGDVKELLLTEIAGTTTAGAAWKPLLGTQPGNDYEYTRFDISQLQTRKIVVDGVSFGVPWPLLSAYDSNDQLLYRYGFGDFIFHNNEQVLVPENTAYVIVNGYTSSSRTLHPKVRVYTPTKTQQEINNEIIAALGDAINKKYLFIGDSYCEGYSHDGNNGGWRTFVIDYMNLQSGEYAVSYRGGASFSNASNNFKTLLQQHAGEQFTDVVVCGGFNDYRYTQAQIEAGILDFYNTAQSQFPGCNVHVGAIGYIKAGTGESAYTNWQEVRTKIETIVIPAYKGGIKHGCSYLNNVEYMLGVSGLTPTDGYHPSEQGNKDIALGIANALKTGSAPLPYNSSLRSA